MISFRSTAAAVIDCSEILLADNRGIFLDQTPKVPIRLSVQKLQITERLDNLLSLLLNMAAESSTTGTREHCSANTHRRNQDLTKTKYLQILLYRVPNNLMNDDTIIACMAWDNKDVVVGVLGREKTK